MFGDMLGTLLAGAQLPPGQCQAAPFKVGGKIPHAGGGDGAGEEAGPVDVVHVPVEHGELHARLPGERAGPPGAGAILLQAHGTTRSAVIIPPRAQKQVLDAAPHVEGETSFGIIRSGSTQVLTALSLL